MIYYLYIYIYLNIHIIVISACSLSYYHENWIKTVEFKSARHPPGTPTQPGERDLRNHRVHPDASSSSSPGLGTSNWMEINYSKPPEVFPQHSTHIYGWHWTNIQNCKRLKNMSGLSHPSNWKHVSPCPHARFVALGLPHKHHIERGRKRKREREFHQLNSTIYSTFFAGEPQFSMVKPTVLQPKPPKFLQHSIIYRVLAQK